jgi:hypothetical protein
VEKAGFGYTNISKYLLRIIVKKTTEPSGFEKKSGTLKIAICFTKF